jgi:His-Xaa-Ser system protein HxsD
VSSTPEDVQFEAESEFTATLHLDPRIYTREAILKTCYWYTKLAYFRFPESSSGHLVLQVRLKQMAPTLEEPKLMAIEEFVDEFCNSLLDFELRRQVEAETASVRQLVLAKAFAESGVLEDEPPGTITDPVEASKPSSLIQIMRADNPSKR